MTFAILSVSELKWGKSKLCHTPSVSSGEHTHCSCKGVHNDNDTSKSISFPAVYQLSFSFSAPRLKHYKVMSKGTSYVIELERQVSEQFPC